MESQKIDVNRMSKGSHHVSGRLVRLEKVSRGSSVQMARDRPGRGASSTMRLRDAKRRNQYKIYIFYGLIAVLSVVLVVLLGHSIYQKVSKKSALTQNKKNINLDQSDKAPSAGLDAPKDRDGGKTLPSSDEGSLDSEELISGEGARGSRRAVAKKSKGGWVTPQKVVLSILTVMGIVVVGKYLWPTDVEGGPVAQTNYKESIHHDRSWNRNPSKKKRLPSGRNRPSQPSLPVACMTQTRHGEAPDVPMMDVPRGWFYSGANRTQWPQPGVQYPDCDGTTTPMASTSLPPTTLQALVDKLSSGVPATCREANTCLSSCQWTENYLETVRVAMEEQLTPYSKTIPLEGPYAAGEWPMGSEVTTIRIWETTDGWPLPQPKNRDNCAQVQIEVLGKTDILGAIWKPLVRELSRPKHLLRYHSIESLLNGMVGDSGGTVIVTNYLAGHKAELPRCADEVPAIWDGTCDFRDARLRKWTVLHNRRRMRGEELVLDPWVKYEC